MKKKAGTTGFDFGSVFRGSSATRLFVTSHPAGLPRDFRGSSASLPWKPPHPKIETQKSNMKKPRRSAAFSCLIFEFR